MADASLSGIYSRLNGVTPYHPFEADTFADWTLEAGDIVTVSRDGTSYSSPVSSTTLKWNGQHTMSIHSTGEREREPIAKTSKRKYASRGGGMTNNQELYWEVMSDDGMLGSTLRMTASQIRSDVFAANSMLYSYIDQTATYIISHVEDVQNELGSEILQTASQIRSEVHATASLLYSYVDQTATYIESHVEDVANDLGSQILQTASQIYTAVYAANSLLYSYIDQTATYISSHVDDVQNDLHSEILQTQSMIRSAVWTANSMVYSYIDQTATYIVSVVEDVNNDLGSQILQTDSQIYSTVYATSSTLYSYIDQTATYIESVVADTANDLGSQILQTASQIYSSVYAANSTIYSYIDQTATSIESVVANTASGLRSEIRQTADDIYTAVYAADSSIYSYIDETATSITTVVANTASGLRSEIRQTADDIYSAVYAADSSIYSYIDETATSINTVVANTASGLQSQITQTSDTVGMVVSGTGSNAKIKPAAIQASINTATGSSKIRLSADNIILDGDAVANSISGMEIDVEALNSGTINAEEIYLGEDDLEDVVAAFTDVESSTSGNTVTLTFTQLNGETKTVTFNKAASKVSGSWSGGTFTVSANDNGQNLPLSTAVYKGTGAQFESWSGNTYTGTIVYYPDGEHQGSVGRTFTVTAPVTSKSITENGTYSTVPSGYVGWNSITVNVPSDIGYAETRFGSSQNGYYAASYDNRTGNIISNSSVTYKLGLSGTTVQVQNTSGTQISNTATYSIPLTSKSITSNGTYSTVPSGYVGWNSITVDVPNEIGNARARFGSGNGSYFIGAYNNSTGDLISNSSVTYKLGLSGTTVQVQNSSGTQISNTATLSIATEINNAKNSVSITGPTWSITSAGSLTTSNTATVKTNAPTPATKDIAFSMIADADWTSDHKKHVYTRADGTSYLRYLVDASDIFTAGQNSVEITGFSTTSPGGESASGHTNNSAGYELSGSGSTANAYIVVKGTIYYGSTSTTRNSWLGAAPTNLYRKGYADGSSSVSITGPTWSITAAGSLTTTNTATFTTNATTPDTKSVAFSMIADDSWTSGHKKHVYTRADGTSYLRYLVDASDVYVEGQTNTSINGFSTQATSGQSASGYTNNSYGYQLSGSGLTANAFIVVTGTIYYGESGKTSAESSSTTRNSWIGSAPTNLYRQGYTDGWNAATSSSNLDFVYQGDGDRYFDIKYPRPIGDPNYPNVNSRFWLIEDSTNHKVKCWVGNASGATYTVAASVDYTYPSHSATLTRATTSISSSGASTGAGKLYVYNSTNNSYGLAGPSSNRYWYYSTTGITSGTTVYY